MDLLKFMKNWTLPLAMLAGVIGYFVFANFTFLEPTKPFIEWVDFFSNSFLDFCPIVAYISVKLNQKSWFLEYGMAGCWLFKLFLVVSLRCC